jgi:hypothetical protein
MELSERHLDMLRHMLGINDRFWMRQPEPYRNYAAMNPGDTRMAELEALGMVECYRRASDKTEFDWFQCTPKGEAAAKASFMEKRFPKAKRVYHRYLDLSDCLPDLTFRDFLTNPDYKGIRAEA